MSWTTGNERGSSGSQVTVQRELSFTRQLKTWSTSDVIRWLENRKLHKFILLFQRHHVAGIDLVDLQLPFLEEYDHINTEDRELLLAEVYELLRLELPDEADSHRLQTPVEHQKYQAAVQLTKDKSSVFHRSQSVPVVLASGHPPLSSSPSSPSSTTSSPTPKLRKKSESEARGSRSGSGDRVPIYRQKSPSGDSYLGPKTSGGDSASRKKFPSGDSCTSTGSVKSGISGGGTLTKPVRKKLQPLSSSNRSLYDVFDGRTGQEVSCVLLRKTAGQFGMTFKVDNRSHLVIGSIEESEDNPDVRPGDRILEISGHLLYSMTTAEIQRLMETVIAQSEELQLVIWHDCSYRKAELRSNGEFADKRWWNFRKVLTDMQSQDLDPDDIIKGIPQTDMQDLKDRCKLQEEMLELKDLIKDQQTVIEGLQGELTNKEEAINEMTCQKDAAVKAATHIRAESRRGASAQGESEYYNMTMDNLKVEDAPKDKVLASLKEIVKEASRQKLYLDRLISVVIEESPWILEQVDADFDDIPQDTQSEEYC